METHELIKKLEEIDRELAAMFPKSGFNDLTERKRYILATLKYRKHISDEDYDIYIKHFNPLFTPTLILDERQD